jgi:hypothetical protein
MKKLAVILLALSLVRVGVAYADTTTAQSDEFAAGETSIVTDANQVLYFYKGDDGQDGQDGRDGQDGANGVDGADGSDGADGVNVATTSFTGERGGCTNGGVQINAVDNVTYICNGPTGTGVISVLFTGSRGTCTNGGVQLTDSTGAITYACNGSNGANGANGTNGTDGTNGTGGSGSGTTTAGQGVLSISSCESDTAITLNPVRLFDGEDFHFNQIQMGDATSSLGDIEATCAGKPVSFYLTIATGRPLVSNAYNAGEILKCTATLPAANQWPGGSPWQFSFLSSANWLALSTPASHELRLRCYRGGGTGAELELNSINTADYTNRIGFEIGQ